MIGVTSFSEAGGHPVNEDAFEVLRLPGDLDVWLCFLADGQGGRAGGGPAAQLACRTAAEAALRLSPSALDDPRAWETVLREADQAVTANLAAGFTTLLGFAIRRGTLTGASNGDSAVLVVSGNGIAQQATADQFKNPPVGSGGAKPVGFSVPLAKPWTVLAMSDGVWKYAGWERIHQAILAPRAAPLVEALQRLARPRSGQFPDDFTVVTLESPADCRLQMKEA